MRVLELEKERVLELLEMELEMLEVLEVLELVHRQMLLMVLPRGQKMAVALVMRPRKCTCRRWRHTARLPSRGGAPRWPLRPIDVA